MEEGVIYWSQLTPSSISIILFFRSYSTSSNNKLLLLRGMTSSASILNSGAHSFRFLGSQKFPCFFLTFLYPVPFPKNYVIFIGCNFKHVQVRLDCTSRKKILRQQRRDLAYSAEEDKTHGQGCALDLTAQDLASGDWKYCLAGPAGWLAGVGFLIYSQKARMSRIYYLQNGSSLGRFAA